MITPTATNSPAHPLETVLDANPAVVRGFSRAVTDALRAGTLSLANRDRLIERGVRLGLKRFDANLIIAVIEQRRRESAPFRITHDVLSESSPPLPRWLRWATVATIQLAIATGVWWVVR